MKFSFQTVWIIFGVTLAHLFVISALSPTGGARRDLFVTEDPDPADPPGKQTGAEAVSTSEMAAPAAVDAKEKAAEIIQIKDPSTVATGGEAPVPSAGTPSQSPTPVESLVETAATERSAVPVDSPAISSPPRVIREIRDLKPVRRS